MKYIYTREFSHIIIGAIVIRKTKVFLNEYTQGTLPRTLLIRIYG